MDSSEKEYKTQTICVQDYGYTHSADSLFHFVKEFAYLQEILERRALIPRHCREDIGYLNLSMGGHGYSEISVLEKCFCDIPLHQITRQFRAMVKDDKEEEKEEDSSHTALYGEYGIAFSKGWAEGYNLQPIQYLNPHSSYCNNLSEAIALAYDMEEVSDTLEESFLQRLAFIKPLHGWMKRGTDRIYKNFHDEKEWRYVPDIAKCEECDIPYIIANPNMLDQMPYINFVNNNLKSEKYRSIWLTYRYEDICYLIVPNNQARQELIQVIMNIPNDMFEGGNDISDISKQRYTLISKILVLEQIRRDW